MAENSNGLILRIRQLTETSLLVHWLTSRQGRLTTVAKGARRTKSPFNGQLDLMYEADFSFRRSRQSEIHTLTEVSQTRTHVSVRRDIVRLRLMAYATRFIEQTTEPENPLMGIHVIFTSLLEHLDHANYRPALVYALEMKLLSELGLSPALNESRLDDHTVELLEQLAVRNWGDISNLEPQKTQVLALKEYLHGFLIYHLGKCPKWRDSLLAG